MAQQKVIQLEGAGWLALASSGEAAMSFYEKVLDNTVVFQLPGGLVLDERADVLQSISGAPWDAVELTEMRVLSPTDDTALVVYRVAASRDGNSYSALIGSLYAHRESGWKLTFHQQTPT